MENNNPLNKPEKELTQQEIKVLWQNSVLDITGIYEKASEILRIHGSVIGTLGNFSASTGKAKSKKTFNVSAIVAAALKGGTVLRYMAELPRNKRKILYVDTEQSPYHCQKVGERILRLAGLPTDRNPENLQFLTLRKYSPDMRILIVEHAIYNTPNLGLVVIDGIRDMVYDINSPGESTKIITKLMQWTDDRQIHIHTILHQNKSDENARGHIGTELNNKAETVLQVAAARDETVSEVSAVHIRDVNFEKFHFRINEQALPELVEGYSPRQDVNTGKSEKTGKDEYFPYKEVPETIHRKALESIFAQDREYGYGKLIEALKTGYKAVGYEYGNNKADTLRKFLIYKRMIVQQGKAYSYNPDFHY